MLLGDILRSSWSGFLGSHSVEAFSREEEDRDEEEEEQKRMRRLALMLLVSLMLHQSTIPFSIELLHDQ